MTIDEFRRNEEWIRFLFFLDRIYRIDGIFFTCGERPFGRRPLCPDDPKETDHDRFNR